MNRRSRPASATPRDFRREISTWSPVAFLVFVFLLGGGSRSDIASLPPLRGGVVLFAFWAAAGMSANDWRRIRAPLVLLVLLTIWIAVQLVPLPADLWHGLAGRDVVVSIDRILGHSDLSRPMSLTPSETWNSLLAMTVPIAALLVAARTPADTYSRLLTAIVILACISGFLGLLQISSGVGSPVYLYRITNPDSIVGLFSNRNHHAVFLACVIVVAALLLRDELMRRQQRTLVRGALAFAAIALTALTALIGSRAGLAAGVIAFAIGYAMVVPAWRSREIDTRDTRGRRARSMMPSRFGPLLIYLPPFVLAALLGATLWLSGRATGITRVIGEDVAGDLRVQAWPTVQQMVETHWLFGAGFGSFPDLYKMFEPDRLLDPTYFNHAHNDWVEVLITGGLPFALILLASLIWFGRSFVMQGTRNLIKGHRGDLRLPVLTIVLLLAAASAVDYPLRVPSLQAMTIMLIIMLCRPMPTRLRPD